MLVRIIVTTLPGTYQLLSLLNKIDDDDFDELVLMITLMN
jgi:hypothetical protein